MLQTFKNIHAYPQADISIHKNRLPKKGNNIYLNDGIEFEIELTNNTTSRFLTKIKLNGKYISNTGLILRPGEHVYLERYLDTNKRFKFETYSVPKTKGVEKAIANNGLVEIEFYQELVYTSYPSWSGWWQYNDTTTPWSSYSHTTDGTITLDNASITGTITNTAGTDSIKQQFENRLRSPDRAGYDGTISLTSDAVSCYNTNQQELFHKPTKTKETGRIEEGSNSNQKFTEGYGNFSTYVDHTIVYYLFPISEKETITSDDLKYYCTACGRRQKKGWKFCPTCGKKA